MILVKLLVPREGLRPRSVRRVVAYIGLLMAAAFERVGRLRDFKACLWRRHPDVVYLRGCQEVEVGAPKWIDDVVEGAELIVNKMEEVRGVPRGVTLRLSLGLGPADLLLDINIYSDQEVPKLLGLCEEPLGVVVEPTGYIGEESVDNFYALVAAEEATEAVKKVVQHFLHAASALAVRVSTYAGPRTYRLSALIAWVKASKNYGVDLRNAMPLMYRPWPRQLARDLYKLASPRLRRLAGLHGFVKAVRVNKAEVQGLLKKYYEAQFVDKMLMLYPRKASSPAASHERAVADIANALENALRYASSQAVLEVVKKKGLLEWTDYAAKLTEGFGKELRRLMTHV